MGEAKGGAFVPLASDRTIVGQVALSEAHVGTVGGYLPTYLCGIGGGGGRGTACLIAVCIRYILQSDDDKHLRRISSTWILLLLHSTVSRSSFHWTQKFKGQKGKHTPIMLVIIK